MHVWWWYWNEVTFFHILLVPTLLVCGYTYGCMFCMLPFNFVNYVFLLLSLCILIVMFSYFYCYVRSVLCILFHCVVLYIVCVYVYVYCTAATGCQPYCSKQMYHTCIYHVCISACENMNHTLQVSRCVKINHHKTQSKRMFLGSKQSPQHPDTG
jgi:hypothetical protein